MSTTPGPPEAGAGVAARPGSVRGRLGAAAAALSCFVTLFVVVAPSDPMAWEVDVVAGAVRAPDAATAPLWLIMQLGRRSLVPLVAAAVFLVARRARPALATAMAGLLAGVTVDLWKQWASRPRPTGVAVRESADGFGFPSGHTAVAWALAVVIATWLPPRWRWLPITAAALVAAGRIDAGVHYPLDVVGGGLWGLTVGLVVVAATGPRGSAAGPSARHRAVVPGAGG